MLNIFYTHANADSCPVLSKVVERLHDGDLLFPPPLSTMVCVQRQPNDTTREPMRYPPCHIGNSLSILRDNLFPILKK